MRNNYIIKEFPNPGKPKMLFSAPYDFFGDKLLKNIYQDFHLIFAFNAPREETLIQLKTHQPEIWFTATCPPYSIDIEMIRASLNLKIISTPSTGDDHIDKESAKSNKVVVLSIKESPIIKSIFASSEFSFALLLSMINKIPFACSQAKKGIWREKEAEFRSIELHGKTLGLIGYGRIGEKMSHYGNAFGMRILAYDPFKKIVESHVEQVKRDELLKRSDIVSLHIHLNSSTRKFFNASCFDKMKQGSFFLNTSRGEIVDEKAMIHALESGRLKAAAVDVVSNERLPNKHDHPVIKYARENHNLLVSPHIAGCTIESERKAAKDLLKQIKYTYESISKKQIPAY